MSNGNLPAVRRTAGEIGEMARNVARSRLFGIDEAQAFTLMLLAESKGHSLTRVMRFLSKVEPIESGCWLWRGCMAPNGYGKFSMGDRSSSGSTQPTGAHRASYRLFRGPITPPLEIDHLCCVTQRVNPFHLDLVDHRTNLMRGNSMSARYASETHCKRGHEKTPENTYYYKGKAYGCRPCMQLQWGRKAERRKQERNAP